MTPLLLLLVLHCWPLPHRSHQPVPHHPSAVQASVLPPQTPPRPRLRVRWRRRQQMTRVRPCLCSHSSHPGHPGRPSRQGPHHHSLDSTARSQTGLGRRRDLQRKAEVQHGDKTWEGGRRHDINECKIRGMGLIRRVATERRARETKASDQERGGVRGVGGGVGVGVGVGGVGVGRGGGGGGERGGGVGVGGVERGGGGGGGGRGEVRATLTSSPGAPCPLPCPLGRAGQPHHWQPEHGVHHGCERGDGVGGRDAWGRAAATCARQTTTTTSSTQPHHSHAHATGNVTERQQMPQLQGHQVRKENTSAGESCRRQAARIKYSRSLPTTAAHPLALAAAIAAAMYG